MYCVRLFARVSAILAKICACFAVQAVSVKLRGDQSATIGDLQTAVACSKLGVMISLQRLIKFRENGTALVLFEPERQLVRDCGIWSGEDVVVEVCVCVCRCICWPSFCYFSSDVGHDVNVRGAVG